MKIGLTKLNSVLYKNKSSITDKQSVDTPLINLDVSDQSIQNYKEADPYPHVFIENFVNDTNMLDQIIEEYKNYVCWGYDPKSTNYQVKKFFSPWCDANINDIPPTTKRLMNYFNSRPVLDKLEKLTGISGLIADPHFVGGGMHRIDRGGRLSVHSDFNKHPNKPWYRRINLLLYLNKNWQDSWGGDLQLWNKDITAAVKSSSPLYNRAVIFNTTPTAYHGHPHELNCPNGVSRNSIAIYYFSMDRPDHEKDNTTSATWKNIPQ